MKQDTQQDMQQRVQQGVQQGVRQDLQQGTQKRSDKDKAVIRSFQTCLVDRLISLARIDVQVTPLGSIHIINPPY